MEIFKLKKNLITEKNKIKTLATCRNNCKRRVSWKSLQTTSLSQSPRGYASFFSMGGWGTLTWEELSLQWSFQDCLCAERGFAQLQGAPCQLQAAGKLRPCAPVASVAPQRPGLHVMCVRRQGTGRRAHILLLGSWQVLRGADLQTSLSLSFHFFKKKKHSCVICQVYISFLLDKLIIRNIYF